MTRQVRQILSLSLFLLFCSRCAQIVPLGGGKKDTIPPKLLAAEPPQKTTGFNSNRIVLHFDEFVQVKDLPNQMIVSPKLKTAPEVSADGKKVVISLKKEELRPNTTYRVFLGKAIADMHESNSLEGFEYVFSTGDRIDTLRIKGNVSDAFTNKPAGNVLIGLYEDDTRSDSLVFRESPDYLTQSNENGDFFFSNLPKKTFRAYGFADKNRNLVYDGESEKAAFRDEKLKLQSDTSVTMKLFQEEPARTFIRKTQNPYYGLTWVILNRETQSKVTALNEKEAGNIYEVARGIKKDTIVLYYKNITDTLHLVVSPKDTRSDTLHIHLPRNAVAKNRLRAFGHNMQSNVLAVGSAMKLVFATWMDTSRTNISGIRITSREDSLISSKPLSGNWKSVTEYELRLQLKEGVNYTLKADTNTFFDMYGNTNDTIPVKFKTQSKTDLGNARLKMLFHKKRHYLVQLLNEQQQVVREHAVSFSLSSSNAETIDFIGVQPGTYQIKVIVDDNKNQKWDTGDLILKKQPEQVIMVSKQIKILSDWEVEEEIIVKD